MTESRESREIEQLIEAVKPVIEAIIRSRLRVSLRPSDDRRGNEDALEVYHEVILRLVEKLKESEGNPGAGIRDFRGYAATVSYRVLAEYVGSPEWVRLRNKLRYFLRHQAGYALWEADHKKVCGLAAWQNQAQRTADRQRLAQLRHDPHTTLAASAWPGPPVEPMPARDWARLLDAIFHWVDGPIKLNDLVNIVAGLLRIQEDAPPDPVAPLPPPLELHEFLQKLWGEIGQLGPEHRIAYLLNFTDGEGDLGIFACKGIAGIGEIGRTLALSDEQWDRLWGHLPLDAEARQAAQALATDDEKFAFLWRYLPVEDKVIAKTLGCERQDVINRRSKARERLARRLQDWKAC